MQLLHNYNTRRAPVFRADVQDFSWLSGAPCYRMYIASCLWCCGFTSIPIFPPTRIVLFVTKDHGACHASTRYRSSLSASTVNVKATLLLSKPPISPNGQRGTYHDERSCDAAKLRSPPVDSSANCACCRSNPIPTRF